MNGLCPISTLTRCISGLMRLNSLCGLEAWPCEPSLLIRAIVGVMGSVLPELGVVLPPIEIFAVDNDTVFSALTRCCLGVVEPAIEGVAGGMVAAVHVSVTGHSSDLILVTLELLLLL